MQKKTFVYVYKAIIKRTVYDNVNQNNNFSTIFSIRVLHQKIFLLNCITQSYDFAINQKPFDAIMMNILPIQN